MWAQYRKTLIITQLFIFGVCGLVLYSGRANLLEALVLFAVMQLGGIIGAWWSARLKTRLEASRDRLPLERR